MAEDEAEVRVRDLRARRRFAQVYLDELWAARHWPSADFRVYVCLLAFCDGGGGWAVSWKRIARTTGLHRDTVRDSVARLKGGGVISTRARFLKGRQRSNEITIHGPVVTDLDRLSIEGGPETPDEGGPETPDEGGPETPPEGGQETPQTRHTSRTRPERTVPPTPKGKPNSATLSWVHQQIAIQVSDYGWNEKEAQKVKNDVTHRRMVVTELVKLLKREKTSSPTNVIGVSTSYRRLEAALLVVLA